MVDFLAFGRDELAIEKAYALRYKCPGIVHTIKTAEDNKPEQVA